MVVRCCIGFTTLLVLFIPMMSVAQKPFPIKEWKNKLSINKDIGFLQQNEVNAALTALDSTQRCSALRKLQQAASKGNTRFQIRMAVIWVGLTYSLHSCRDSIPDLTRLQKALRQCYEINDPFLAISIHLSLSNVHMLRDELGLAITHELAAKEIMEKEGLTHFQYYARILHSAGDMLYKSRDYRSSAKLNVQALQYHGTDEFNKMDSLDNYWKMNSWNTLGLCYKRLMLYDSAMYAFNRAAQLTNDPFWTGLFKGNRGDVFFLQGKYDSAEALLRVDYTQSLPAGELTNAAISMERMARIKSARGDPKKALSMIRTSDSLEHKSQNKEVRASIWHSYAVIFKDLGQADSSLAYMEKYKQLSDTINKISADNKVEIAQLQLSNQENISEIGSLQKERNRILLIRNFSIALILILSAFTYVYINRMRLKAKLKQQEVNQAKEQLNIFITNLQEKTKLLEELQSRSVEKEMHQEQIEQMQELTTYTLLTDDDWERFKNLFNKVYPGFFVDLKLKVPDITLAEQRMAALIKLHVNNKDAAGMLGISHNSIYKTRQRLRQRLGYEKDEEMDGFFRG